MSTMQGDLGEYALTDLVQFLHGTRKQGYLQLHSEQQRHESGLYFAGGEVVHAHCPPNEGERAFYQLLRWQQGRFSFFKDRHPPFQTIGSELKGLLLEGMRRLDEYRQLCAALPPFATVLHVERDSRKVENIRINQGAWRLLALINGRRTIAEVIDQYGRDELVAVRAIGLMLQHGLVATTRDEAHLDRIVLARLGADAAARNRMAPQTILASVLLNQVDGARSLLAIRRQLNCSDQDFAEEVHLLLRTGWVRVSSGAEEFSRYF
jgi:hypothetical protein